MTTITLDSYADFSQTLDKTKIAIRSTSYAYQYTVSGGSVTHVTDVNYPATTVRGLVYLDGTFYVMDKYGQIWGSAVNDFTTWSALNVITAQAEPDGGVCITKYAQYIVAFGQYKTQFFFDNGNATGSPLSPVQNVELMVGCAAGDTVQQMGTQVFFISQQKVQGQAASRGFAVSELVGFDTSPISTPDVERILNADGCAGAWGAAVSLFGHDLYFITLPTTLQTLAYDIKNKLWFFFNKMTAASPVSITSLTCATQTDGTGLVTAVASAHGNLDGDPVVIAGASQTAYNGTFNITRVDANTFTYVISTPQITATGSPTATGNTASYFPLRCAFQSGTTQVFQNDATGRLYNFVDTLFTDDGAYIDAKVRNEPFDTVSYGPTQIMRADQPKFLPWMDVVTDRISSNILERHSDDDYQTYTKYRAASLSGTRTRFSRNGRFIRRAIEFRHTDTVSLRLRRVDLGLEPGVE